MSHSAVSDEHSVPAPVTGQVQWIASATTRRRMFNRFRHGRLLPWLLMLSMLGNVIDCVRVDHRGAQTTQTTQRRRRRYPHPLGSQSGRS